MSKAFTKETDQETEEPDETDSLLPQQKNYMTPYGLDMLKTEQRQLERIERPKIVEIVAWAAGNGDRSENGDYLYGKKRLREIDRRLRYLSKRIKSAELVDPEKQQGLTQAFFGATVCYADKNGETHTVTLVGIDEADLKEQKISWISPVARALLKAKVGDEVELKTPAGTEMLEVLEISYKLPN